MAAPTRSFAEITHAGQESVAAVVRIWADLAKASVEVITTGRGALLDGRSVADFVFGFANQVLDGQRALLSALTATSTGRITFAEIAAAPASTNGAVAKTAAEVAEMTTVAAAEVAETATDAAAEVAETATDAEVAETTTTEADAEVAETTVETPVEVAETTAETVAEVAVTTAEGPYGKGSHAPLADRSESPAGFEIKGNDGSKLYHVPGSTFYKRTVAEVWFATPEAAEAAGFQRPASQR